LLKGIAKNIRVNTDFGGEFPTLKENLVN
jgi:hypothetical protein